MKKSEACYFEKIGNIYFVELYNGDDCKQVAELYNNTEVTIGTYGEMGGIINKFSIETLQHMAHDGNHVIFIGKTKTGEVLSYYSAKFKTVKLVDQWYTNFEEAKKSPFYSEEWEKKFKDALQTNKVVELIDVITKKKDQKGNSLKGLGLATRTRLKVFEKLVDSGMTHGVFEIYTIVLHSQYGITYKPLNTSLENPNARIHRENLGAVRLAFEEKKPMKLSDGTYVKIISSIYVIHLPHVVNVLSEIINKNSSIRDGQLRGNL